MTHRPSRRRFLGQSAAALGVLALPALSYRRVYGANARLRVASVGTGGKGWSDLTSVAASPSVDVAALCDVDSTAEHLGRAAEKYPSAKTFADWRRLLDEEKTFDAVIVSTPDHMHAPIALAAMARGKHVYCQKPLTHTAFEARQMAEAAAKAGVVTQMGNQIQSHEAYRTAVKLIQDGTIGKVREVRSWQANPMGWLPPAQSPPPDAPAPPAVAWDGWLGVAAARPYKPTVYHPFNWRAWQAFGTGQLGDFGCHILDPVFLALGLTSPTTMASVSPGTSQKASYQSPPTSSPFSAGRYATPISMPSWSGRAPVRSPRCSSSATSCSRRRARTSSCS